jgi:hypothetical protein
MATAREVILAVMQEVQGVAKRDRNSAQGFNFRGIDAVMNKVGPALRNAGGFILPEIKEATHSTALTAKGSAINVCHLTVQFGIYGLDGEPITGSVQAEAFDSGDKATAKAMSVALRSFLLQVLALPTDEPDPDSFTYEASRDWAGEAEQLALLYAVDGLRKLYSEAVAARAPKEILERIKAYGNAAGGQGDSVGKPAGTERVAQ